MALGCFQGQALRWPVQCQGAEGAAFAIDDRNRGTNYPDGVLLVIEGIALGEDLIEFLVRDDPDWQLYFL